MIGILLKQPSNHICLSINKDSIDSLSLIFLVLLHRTENTYLSWKENPNHASSIHIRQVESDGITFREEWQDVKLIQADLIHDLLTTEGSWIIYRFTILSLRNFLIFYILRRDHTNQYFTSFYFREPYYYLLFSTHLFVGPYYQTEVARSRDVLGPYERLQVPISHTDFDRYNYGVNCTFVSPGMLLIFCIKK